MVANFHFDYYVPTGKTTDAIAMNFFQKLPLLHIILYSFEGYSSQYKIDEMVNNYSNSCK